MTPSGNRSWLVYLLMVLALVGCFVAMNVADLRVRSRGGEPDSAAVGEAIRRGDILIRQALLPLPGADKHQPVNAAIDAYRDAGSDPDALRRIGVARESLLGRSGKREFERLSSADGSSDAEARMWQRIYGPGALSAQTARQFSNTIKDLDLGPLTDIAISDVYEKAGLDAKAESAKESAETDAVTNMLGLILITMFLAGAGLTGLVVGAIFLTRHARALRAAPLPRIQPTVLMISFLVYLVSYVLLGVVLGTAGAFLGYDEGTPAGSSIDLLLQLIAMFGSLALASTAFSNMIAITGEDFREIGLRFKRASNEVLWGLGAYCTALPVLGVTALISRLLTETVFRHIETPEHPIVPTVTEGGLPLLMAFIVAVIAAPIVEEIAFRGFLYTALRGTMGVWAAAALTSALFAAIHPTLPGQFLPLFGLAMVLAIVREKTGSLLPSIVCHALNNLMTLLMVSVVS